MKQLSYLSKKLLIVGIAVLLLAVGLSGCIEVTQENGGNNRENEAQSNGRYNEYPVADAGGPYLGYTNQPLILNGLGSYDPDGYIVSYNWDFGDGFIGNGASSSHIYSVAGIYTVTLVVTDENGASNMHTSTVTIREEIVFPETIFVSGNYIEQTIHYLDKPVKLFYSGNYNDVTVTKETNLIKVFLSGNYNILRVSKSHSFEQFISGNGCKIVYYD